MTVYVFKTSVKEEELAQLKPLLDELLIDCKWNFDFQDIDHILRVESNSNITQQIIIALTKKRILCEIL